MLDFGEVLRWTALFLLSCVVPFGIFVGRNNIRAFRREIVRDLEKLFSFARLPNRAPLIIPSFELVKYKYDPESNPNRDPRDNPHSVIYYLLPVSIYIVLTALGFLWHSCRTPILCQIILLFRSASLMTSLLKLAHFSVP
jgi:hypothetical protein